jgi:hypothetical protein
LIEDTDNDVFSVMGGEVDRLRRNTRTITVAP